MGCTYSKKTRLTPETIEYPIPPSLEREPSTRCAVITRKEGALYSAYKKNIRPFDLVFFRGPDFVSTIIAYAEKKQLKRISEFGYDTDSDAYTHCGMVVTSDILDHPLIVEGKLYIWESTMTGNLAPDGVKNITGRSFFGSQLRDLDTLIDAYDIPDNTSIAVSHFTTPIEYHEVKEKFTMIFHKYDAIPYEKDPIVMSASIFQCVRPIRDAEGESGEDLEMFCSELVARVYIELGFLPDTVVPSDVVPMDFLGFDTDANGITTPIVSSPERIVSLRHFLVKSDHDLRDAVSLDIDWFGASGRIEYHGVTYV